MNPCIDYCRVRFNRQHTTECNEHCDYAKACLKLAEANANVERLQTLADLGNTRANDYRVMRDKAIKAEEENGKLRAELKKMKQELDAAVDCIYQIEDDLNRGNDNDWAREHITEWESQKED